MRPVTALPEDPRVTRPATIVALAALLLVSAGESAAQLNYNETGYGVEPMDYSRVGTAGWQFLKLPTDARSMAMGGVRSAAGYGTASSAFTNPASAADVRGFEVHFSTMEWVADIRTSGVSVVKEAGEWGTFGVNLVYVDYGDMQRTEIGEFNGQPGVVAVTEGLGTFSAHDMAVGILYARRITDKLQLGGTIRYIREQLDDAVMGTWGVDIGTIYWTGLGSLRISMLGRNFGPDGEFTEYEGRIAQAPASVRMPMLFVLGAGYDVVEPSVNSPHRLTVAGEYVKPNDAPEKFNLGAEYFGFDYFTFRAGYRFNYDEEGFTLGAGATYAVEDEFRLRVDFAYADLARFNDVMMFTVGVGF